ncbi:short-chain dehydrogenase [Candidatus Peregrinibacteria bacterium CG_4_9_14_3_um_filter_49_12]|nr:MAG: short-chain dehydrogenase [Candidatus Peregrinibacteria bacterium CG_4_9_14_3_um_filter_49_12]
MKSAALITGASGGIGLEFAKICAKEGRNLVLVARRKDVLEKEAAILRKEYNVHVLTLAADLSSLGSAKLVWTEASEAYAIDTLINNAGIGLYGEFVSADTEKEMAMMQLNMVCLTELTKLALPSMRARKNGKILNVSSVAAFVPGPLMAVYYATKAYVLSFSEALAEENRNTGVTVTALCPGPTATGFEKKANLGRSVLFQSRLMTPESVAMAGYKGMMKGTVIVLPGLRQKVMIPLLRCIPRSVIRRAVRYFQRPL